MRVLDGLAAIERAPALSIFIACIAPQLAKIRSARFPRGQQRSPVLGDDRKIAMGHWLVKSLFRQAVGFNPVGNP